MGEEPTTWFRNGLEATMKGSWDTVRGAQGQVRHTLRKSYRRPAILVGSSLCRNCALDCAAG
jgi:hypothetical protein